MKFRAILRSPSEERIVIIEAVDRKEAIIEAAMKMPLTSDELWQIIEIKDV